MWQRKWSLRKKVPTANTNSYPKRKEISLGNPQPIPVVDRVKNDKASFMNLEEGKVHKWERVNGAAICRNQEGRRSLELDTKAEEKGYLEFGSEERINENLDPKTKGEQFQINSLQSTST